MKGVARRRQTKARNSSSTSPTTTDTRSNIISPHKTNTQTSPAHSDVFDHLDCKLNELQSALKTPKAHAAAIATVDQDLDAVKRVILSMFTRRNMVAPISILPAEILARIFHLTAFSEQPYSLGWVHVTYVCRRWRQIALDDSTLWTHFSTCPHNKDWITERLSRARNAPLVIELNRAIGKDTFSLFTPHLSHTRELYLLNQVYLHPEVVQEINPQRAPAMERLEFSVPVLSSINHRLGRSFDGPLPNVRIFCVSNIHVPWSLVPRDRLTQLKVTHIGEAPGARVSPRENLNQLIDLLTNCPSLEVLMLENCLPAMLSKSSGRQEIHLPWLSRLCLGGSSSRVTNLLTMLKLSSSTTLRLTCTSENTATHNDHHILPFLSAHFNHPTPAKFRGFKISLNSMDRAMEMVASTSLAISPISHTPFIQADRDPELSLSFRHSIELDDRVDILRRACNVLSLSNIEFLSMHSLSLNEFINWSEIFQHCTEVTTVQVSGRGTIGLLETLTPPKRANTKARGKGRKRKRGDDGRYVRAQALNHDDDHAPAPMHVLIFPKLTSLLFEMLDFTDAVSGSGVLYNLVLSVVRKRKANKAPLTTLCINHCIIKEKQAKALEKVVPDFQWDHDEDGYYDGERDRENYYNNYYNFDYYEEGEHE